MQTYDLVKAALKDKNPALYKEPGGKRGTQPVRDGAGGRDSLGDGYADDGHIGEGSGSGRIRPDVGVSNGKPI